MGPKEERIKIVERYARRVELREKVEQRSREELAKGTQ
jgi:hypothetical protein